MRPVGIIFAILILWMTSLNFWASHTDAPPVNTAQDEYVLSGNEPAGTPVEIQSAGASLLHSVALTRASTRRHQETTSSLAIPVYADCLSQWSASIAFRPQFQRTQAPPPPVFRPLLN